jgi:IS30 family transposase
MQAKHTITEIAQLMERNKSTISREIKRNTGGRGYRPKKACDLAAQRALSSRNARTIDAWVIQRAREYLHVQFSPEQIAAKLPVSHETLYQYVYADRAAGGQLWKNLRCKKQRRKRHAAGRDRRGQIPNRRPLSERPAHVEKRHQIGHWEGDTVIGVGHKCAIVTLVERKSGFARIKKVANKSSELVSRAIVELLSPFCAKVNTLTFDNGKEFAAHEKIDQALGSTSFFARPYASWERGSNENFNGLLRQYIPKTRPMEDITDEEIRMIEDRLNNRPRKRLGFKTPSEVFYKSFNRVALRA